LRPDKSLLAALVTAVSLVQVGKYYGVSVTPFENGASVMV
jgi:hypothetical protein